MANSLGLFFQLIELFNHRDGAITIGRMIDLIGHEIDCHPKLSKSDAVSSALNFLRLSEALGAATKLGRAIDDVVLGTEAKRGCAVLCAALGDVAAMADVATSLMSSAYWDHFDSEAECDARIVRALGWFVIASGGRTFAPTLRSKQPDGPLLAGYELAGRIRGMKSLSPYLASVIGEADQSADFGPRYRRNEVVECGLPIEIVGTTAGSQFQTGVNESPVLETGIIAAKIARRFPAFRPECEKIIDYPTDVASLRDLISVLEDQDLADAGEEVEALVLAGAQLGDRESLLRSAAYAVRRGYHQADRDLLRYALGALAVGSGVRCVGSDGDAQQAVVQAGRYLVQAFECDPQPEVASVAKVEAEEGEKRDPQSYSDIVSDPIPEPVPESSLLRVAEEARVAILNARRETVKVIADKINTSTASADAKSAIRSFSVLEHPLALAPMPIDLVTWRSELLAEFPHAIAAIDAIYSDFAARRSTGKQSFGFRPSLLVGAPGCGKSRLARRLAQTAGIAFKAFPCGGIADSHFAGVSRGWHSALPSAPLELIRTSRMPNPVLLMDEIEKAATSRHNGSLIDVLLSMLEPETSSKWIDPYLQTPVDLSHLCWLFTANSVDLLPAPFRDRVRIIQVPKPDLDHLPQLTASILRDLDGRHGWHQPLDQDELDAIADAWGASRSVRALRRLIGGVLKAREQAAPRH